MHQSNEYHQHRAQDNKNSGLIAMEDLETVI